MTAPLDMLFGQSSAHIDYETIEEAFGKLAKWGMNHFELFGHKLLYTHIADNDGVSDQRIGAGRGTINWPRALADTLATGFRGPFTIEYSERFADECHDDVRRWLGLCDG